MKRLKRFVNTNEPASITYRISNLGNVQYYGISGGLISNNNHLRLIDDAVRHFKPCHIIVIFGGNDLDSNDEHFHLECTLTPLIAFFYSDRTWVSFRYSDLYNFYPKTCVSSYFSG